MGEILQTSWGWRGVWLMATVCVLFSIIAMDRFYASVRSLEDETMGLQDAGAATPPSHQGDAKRARRQKEYGGAVLINEGGGRALEKAPLLQ